MTATMYQKPEIEKMVLGISMQPASQFQKAAARIHTLLDGVTNLDKADLSALDGAFHAIDYGDIQTNDDAIAVLSVARLMLDHVFHAHKHRVKTDGDAQLLQSVQKLSGRMMACAVQCHNSVGGEIFRISMPNSPEKALRSVLDALFWFRKCVGRPFTP